VLKKNYGRSARSRMEDFPFLSIKGYRSTNMYNYISPLSYINKYVTVYGQTHKKYKDSRFFLLFFIHHTSKDTNQQFIAIFIPYVVCVYYESARIK
jgi:hypothetical protein